MTSLGVWIAALLAVPSAIGVMIGATAWLASRWRRADNESRDEYIAGLREFAELKDKRAVDEAERADRAEARAEEAERENRRLEGEIRKLEGRLSLLEDLVLKRCPQFEASEEGGCRHCTRRLAYGSRRVVSYSEEA